MKKPGKSVSDFLRKMIKTHGVKAAEAQKISKEFFKQIANKSKTRDYRVL